MGRKNRRKKQRRLDSKFDRRDYHYINTDDGHDNIQDECMANIDTLPDRRISEVALLASEKISGADYSGRIFWVLIIGLGGLNIGLIAILSKMA